MPKEMFLECSNGSHPPIKLPDKRPISVGRSPQTAIEDSRISRQHVELTAYYSKREVHVKQLGRHPSRIEDTDVSVGTSAVLGLTQTLWLLPDLFPHTVKETKLIDADSPPAPTQKAPASTTDCPAEDDSSPRKRKAETMTDSNANDDSSPRKRKASMMDFFGTGKTTNKRKASPDNDNSDSSKSTAAKQPRLASSTAACVSDSGSDNEDEIAQRLQAFKNDMHKIPKREKTEKLKVSESPPDASGCGETSSKPAVNLDDIAAAESSRWDVPEKSLLTYISCGVKASDKVAAFDIDGTIICTQSGRKFPLNTGDWKILYSEIPGRLKKLHAQGYKIVFFTNQMGIQRGKLKVEDFKEKVEAIIKKLGIPIQALVSMGTGPYRKPNRGMWTHLCQHGNSGVSVDLAQSVYVGDAAGRPKNWAPKENKDFSGSDRLFALNIGIPFKTPEEYFKNYRTAKFDMPEFDPHQVDTSVSLLEPSGAKLKADKQEIIVLTGSPASGKSYFATSHLVPEGYIYVNRDKLKTWQKCVEACQAAVTRGQRVVVDNTNPDTESRKRYVDVARKAGVPCRCFVLQPSMSQIRHNERFRELTDKSHTPIDDRLLYVFRSKFVPPALSEGFTEIVQVNFKPKFDNPQHEQTYKQFLIDK